MRFPAFVLAVLCALSVWPRSAAGQGTVTGMVVDADNERALPNAIVSLWDQARAKFSASVLSDSAGRYHLRGLSVGGYTLMVRAIGYRPTQLTVVVDSVAISRVSVALAVHPVRLQSIRVARPVPAAFGDALESGTAPLAGDRQSSSMTLDPASLTLTARDLRDAVTFAERDPMRALQRVPGVTSRDDYSSAMWTRGASFDKTLVTFDGLPLFNALHAAGLMSTINPDIVGALEFHPGVQPAGSIGGGAGVAAFQSRRASAFEATRVAAELSLLTGRMSVERASQDGRNGLLVAVRRSHVDRSSALLESALGAGAPVPFAFGDVVVRADAALSPSAALEFAGMWDGDRLWGDVPGVVERTTGDWGGRSGRASAVYVDGDREMRFTLGASGFSANAMSHDSLLAGKLSGYQIGDCGCVYAATEFAGQPLSNTMSFRMAELSWRRRDDSGRIESDGGLQFAGYDAAFATTGSWPHWRNPGVTVERASSRRLLSGWGERLVRRGRASVTAGVRVEHAVDDPLLVAPKLSARYQVTTNSSVSAGASRGYQHAQALHPAGSGRSTIATADMFWIVSGDRVPPLRADLLTGGWQWSSSEARAELSLTAYGRWSHGMLVADPRPGALTGDDLFVPARGRARGLEMGARKHVGRSSISASYARSRSMLHAGALEYAAPWGREQVMRAGTSIGLPAGVRWMSQYGYESGAHYTRYFSGFPNCYFPRDVCRWGIPPVVGEPSAHRMAPQHSLDSSIEWTFSIGRTRYGLFGQGVNLIRSRTVSTYLETRGLCVDRVPTATCDPMNGRWDTISDMSLAGMPRTWSVGLRAVY